jgi:hypothetical protein
VRTMCSCAAPNLEPTSPSTSEAQSSPRGANRLRRLGGAAAELATYGCRNAIWTVNLDLRLNDSVDQDGGALIQPGQSSCRPKRTTMLACDVFTVDLPDLTARAPSGILPGGPHDQLDGLGSKRRSSGALARSSAGSRSRGRRAPRPSSLADPVLAGQGGPECSLQAASEIGGTGQCSPNSTSQRTTMSYGVGGRHTSDSVRGPCANDHPAGSQSGSQAPRPRPTPADTHRTNPQFRGLHRRRSTR